METQEANLQYAIALINESRQRIAKANAGVFNVLCDLGFDHQAPAAPTALSGAVPVVEKSALERLLDEGRALNNEAVFIENMRGKLERQL